MAKIQFLDYQVIFWLSGLFLDYPESFWIVWTVSGLSGQFLDCSDCFWIVRTVFGLFGHFLNFLDNFWIIRIVYGFYGQFLDCEDSLVKTFLSGQFWDCLFNFDSLVFQFGQDNFVRTVLGLSFDFWHVFFSILPSYGKTFNNQYALRVEIWEASNNILSVTNTL